MLVMREYRLDPATLPFNRVKRLGIEVIPAEVRRNARAAASVRAMQAAREARVEILPRPRGREALRVFAYRHKRPRRSAPPNSRERSC